MTTDQKRSLEYDAPKVRCSYCDRGADAFVRDARYGKDTAVCEEHLAKAVDGLLAAPSIFRIPSGDRLTVKVTWTVE